MDNGKNIQKARIKAQLISKTLCERQQEVEEDAASAVEYRSESLSNHLQKAEGSLAMSTTVSHALVDAQIYHKLFVYSKKQADKLQISSDSVGVRTLTGKLVGLMDLGEKPALEANHSDDSGALCFIGLGKQVMPHYLTTFSLSFIRGNEPKADACIERNKGELFFKTSLRKRKAPVLKLKDVETDDLEQSEADREIAEMKRVLKLKPCWNYWSSVLDHGPQTGFARSVQNIFHTSFLVKENIAFWDMTKNLVRISFIAQERRQFDESGKKGWKRKSGRNISWALIEKLGWRGSKSTTSPSVHFPRPGA